MTGTGSVTVTFSPLYPTLSPSAQLMYEPLSRRGIGVVCTLCEDWYTTSAQEAYSHQGRHMIVGLGGGFTDEY